MDRPGEGYQRVSDIKAKEMTIHEFGKENDKVIVLLHPSVVMWDYFEYVIPLLEKKYHLIVPALPGYDPDEKSDFTSVEEISSELEDWRSKAIGKSVLHG